MKGVTHSICREKNTHIRNKDSRSDKKIKRFPVHKYNKKVTMKRNNKEQNIEVNRNILSRLLAYSTKDALLFDFELALTYLLTPVPLSIAQTDGTRRKSTKNALMNVSKRNLDDSRTFLLTIYR